MMILIPYFLCTMFILLYNIYKNSAYSKIQTNYNIYNQYKMSVQNSQSKLCSQHSLMASIAYFNETHDKLITCGQDGEIHVYHIVNNKICKVGYANIFNQAIVAVSWGSIWAGGCVAVSGSRGSLAILRVDAQNGQVEVEKYFGMKDTVVSMDWYPTSKILLCGTLKGQAIIITYIHDDWKLIQTTKLPQNGNVYVAWGSQKHPLQFAGCQSTLFNLHHDRTISTIVKLNNQTIKKILIRKEGLIDYLEIIILSNKKLRVYELNCKKASTQVKQEIELYSNVENMEWGSTQSYIACYLQPKQQANKPQTSESNIMKPIVYKRKINGEWIQTI